MFMGANYYDCTKLAISCIMMLESTTNVEIAATQMSKTDIRIVMLTSSALETSHFNNVGFFPLGPSSFFLAYKLPEAEFCG